MPMKSADRTTKTLLTVIALLLALLVARPMLKVSTDANAEDSTSTSTIKGAGVRVVSAIAPVKNNSVKSIQVMDNANCFVALMDDSTIYVYKVADLTITQ
jgi:hypothetical protein